MQEKKLVELWEMIDRVMYLERWLKSPYGFPYMDDCNRAAEYLYDIESFLRAAVHGFQNGTEAELRKWEDPEEDFSLSDELEEIEKIFDQYEEWELTEEAYLERLEEDQDDTARFREDFATITKGIQAIREAI